MRPGILLDRDGTIIVDHGYVGSVDRVEIIEGSAEAIASFNRAGIPVAVITNQSGVARGLYGIEDVDEVHPTSPSSWRSTGPHRPVLLLPVPPGRGRRGVHPRERGPQAGPGHGQSCGDGARPGPGRFLGGGRPTRGHRPGQAVGASAAYLGSEPPSSTRCLAVPEPGGRGPVHPRTDRCMSLVYDLPVLDAREPRPRGEVPDASVPEGRVVLRRLRRGDRRAAASPIDLPQWNAPAAILLEAYRAVPRCSPVATAVRRHRQPPAMRSREGRAAPAPTSPRGC